MNPTILILLQVDGEANESEMVFIDRVKVKCGLIIIDNPSMDPGHSDYLVRLKSSPKRKFSNVKLRIRSGHVSISPLRWLLPKVSGERAAGGFLTGRVS